MMFAMTILREKLDRSTNDGRELPSIRIQGQPCHKVGNLLPMLDHAPKIAQLYIYDIEHEIQNRLQELLNKSSPCIKNGKCFKRRENGNAIEKKNGVSLDNHHVVSHNSKLLLKYQSHVNMEWCNQSTSIKYLFKYINKGYDRITITIVLIQDEGETHGENIDEIKQYLDCRSPIVERLFFHLPSEQYIYFNDGEDIYSIFSKPSFKESIFTSWMQANNMYYEGKNLTYGDFVLKFIYVPTKRIIWVPLSTSELFYLIMMLIIAKGPCSYEDITTISHI
ncbi:hypothetical protein CR513_19622, partial [Mucuna pruriens]